MLEHSKVDLDEVLLCAVIELMLPLRIVSSLLRANRFHSQINRHAVAGQMKRPQAFRTSCPKPLRLAVCAKSSLLPDNPQIYSRNREMSWLTIVGGTLWSARSGVARTMWGLPRIVPHNHNST